MENLRSYEADMGEEAYDNGAIEAPPVISSGERRMQVRAYTYWRSLLQGRQLPLIADMTPEHTEDFSANSVLLDFSQGPDTPAILYLGTALREECGISSVDVRAEDIPAGSLLSHFAEHYAQALADATPVGFDAEFINQRGAEILSRGMLMRFSSDGEKIDFLYGVANWKEVAQPAMIEGLDQAIRDAMAMSALRPNGTPVWEEGPSATSGFPLDEAGDDSEMAGLPQEDMLDLAAFAVDDEEEPLELTALAPAELELQDTDEVLPEIGEDIGWDMGAGLSVALAHARRHAEQAGESDVRSRQALYAAIGAAYDFALSAQASPAEYAEMLAGAAIIAHPQRPNGAVARLIFGVDYDKTRIAEYVCVLDYAFDRAIPHGHLMDYLLGYDGGIKALVRQWRAEKRAGKEADKAARPVSRLVRAARKLQDAAIVEAKDLPFDAYGLAAVIARREADGSVVFVAGVDMADKVAQNLLVQAGKRA